MELFSFQKRAIRELLKSMFIAKNNQITLKAPTGSGKTIILSKLVDVINDIINNNNKAASLIELDFTESELSQFDFVEIGKRLLKNEFVWLSPSTGGLTLQSKTSYDKNIGNNSKTLDEFINNTNLEDNIITFIGMASINSSDNVVRKESEKMNWNDTIRNKKTLGKTFILIFDESHTNDTNKRTELINGSDEIEGLNPICQINASATPNEKDKNIIEITDDEVIAEELITKHIKINESLPSAKPEEENKIVIDTAIKKYKEIKQKYKELYKKGICSTLINPLIIIQYPNDVKGEIIFEEINNYIKEKGYSEEENGEIAKWITLNKKEEKSNLDGITNNDSNVVFLHIKQAASTGWDCPRAKILVKFRLNGETSFQTQTIGRIRRMPEHKHYGIKLLDNCYIYTYDNKWIEKSEKNGDLPEKITLLINKSIITNPELNIYTETKNITSISIGSKELIDMLKTALIKKYGLSNDVNKNKLILESKGYNFDEKSKTEILSGEVTHTERIQKEVNVVKRNVIIEENSNILEKSFLTINSKIKINDMDITKPTLIRLFRKKQGEKSREESGIILALNNKEFRYFIVNNTELLYRTFRSILQAKQNQKEQRKKIAIKKELFILPNSYELKNNSRIKKPEAFKKNAYNGYINSIKSSAPEREFNKYIDNLDKTNWWMKNGDIGEEFLSIVYTTIIGKQYEFYPDYICMIDNKLWIIETKGGDDTNGNNDNIDPQAENKFYALQDWAEENNVNFAFVRLSKDISELYMSNTEYAEDINSDSNVWKKLNF